MRQQGFTLTEILVAMFIGSFALLALLQVQWHSRQSLLWVAKQNQALVYQDTLSEHWLAHSAKPISPPHDMQAIESAQAKKLRLEIQWRVLDQGRAHIEHSAIRQLRRKP